MNGAVAGHQLGWWAPGGKLPDDLAPLRSDRVTLAGDGQALAAFPAAGEVLAALQDEWDLISASGQPAPVDVPRPWSPETCTEGPLWADLMQWLRQFVDWHNTQCAWDPDGHIPPCWSAHPHLTREIAILADQHRRARSTSSSNELELWYRLTRPAFTERMRVAIRQHCSSGHEPLWSDDRP